MPRDRRQLPATTALLFGGTAGCVAKTLVAPFDRVKIHFQVGHPELAPFRGHVTGVFGALRLLHARLGVAGLYRGHACTLARIFPYAALNYAVFERLKHVLGPQPWARLLAGALAGSVAVSLTYPFDIVRARVAYDLAQHAHVTPLRSGLVLGAIRQLRSEHPRFPLAAFYQGFLPTLLGIIPYAGVSFFTFETLKLALLRHREGAGAHAGAHENAHENIKDHTQKPQLPSLVTFACGLVAGALGQTCAYPLDVVRRRQQLHRVAPHLPRHVYAAGALAALRAIVAEQGVRRGLFAGLSINYLKVAPASGVSFLVYETLVQHFS